MSYFGFLAIFLIIPIMIFAIMMRRDRQASEFSGTPLPLWAIIVHVVIAVIYTTPWDNYLVATRVWWYDPELVTGIILGWVPIEEYTFFVLQPILTGLWLAFLVHRINVNQEKALLEVNYRWGSLVIATLVWLASIVLLMVGWQPGTYLGLELVWAMPPLMLQLAFGGDILRRYWRIVLLSILVPTFYLSAADTLAIGWGTWTIDPAQSTGILIGGLLPIEEFIFFLLTNTLISCGLILLWAPESRARLGRMQMMFKRFRQENTA